VPATVNDIGHNDSAPPAELTWGALATSPAFSIGVKQITNMTPSYDYATRTCSNTYCHSGVRNADGDPQGISPNPVWGNVEIGCDYCHGNPPAYPHQQNAACSGCHTHVDQTNVAFVSSYTLSDGVTHVAGKSLHVNGLVEYSEDRCWGCHNTLGTKALIGGHLLHTDADYFLATNVTGTAGSGVASATTTSTSLTDSSKSWTNHQWKGMLVLMTSGQSANTQVEIVDNTQTTLTLKTPLPYSVASGDGYQIRQPKSLSNGDYDDPTWIFNINYENGFPRYACGFCHPMKDASVRNNGIVEIMLDPADAPSDRTTVKRSEEHTSELQSLS
jgi:predicted CxxxxCH...CXXCH cytochrome family protein